MRRLRRLRPLAVVLAAAMLGYAMPLPAAAQQAPPQPVDIDASLQQARELIRAGKYDGAIEILQPTLEDARNLLQKLREVYLLLIESWVYLGNTIKPQSPQSARSNYNEAKALIRELLLTYDLRHTQPDALAPPEVIQFFADVRAEIFGSFRIRSLRPEHAVAILDADTLRALPGDTALGDTDLRIGRHQLVIRAEGYKDLLTEVDIKPNSTFEPSYELGKTRSKLWYLGGGVAAVAGTVVALVAGGDEKPPAALEPLPEPPGPPSR